MIQIYSLVGNILRGGGNWLSTGGNAPQSPDQRGLYGEGEVSPLPKGRNVSTLLLSYPLLQIEESARIARGF